MLVKNQLSDRVRLKAYEDLYVYFPSFLTYLDGN